MLESYLFPISYAFMAFPLAAGLFTLPFLTVQYRRHGYINKFRAVVLYLLLLYLMNALFLVLLPLPASIHNAPRELISAMQWIPFHFIHDIIQESAMSADSTASYVHLLKERAFLQVLFNVILTMPFGFFLRYYFRSSRRVCVAASFGLSLFFEVTQLTGIYGIFDYPYRLFDVDDLMANTLGGMMGFALSARLSGLLPKIDKLDDQVDLAAQRVTYIRRALALLLDGCLLLPLWAFLIVIRVPYPCFLLAFFYYGVLTYVTNGRTFGKWVVRIRLTGRETHIRIRELLIRYGLLFAAAAVLEVAVSGYVSTVYLALGAGAAGLIGAVMTVHLFRCMLNRSRKPFYEARSGTGFVVF
ncbi:VanZ family protein [Gorillibacterium sp. sgz5001074]|uniref:VanZ family protein n=1 Tax=Gorillibacterium sp. sgz5001074 TaxID=3446695 RepID=UPI003F679DA9